MADITKREKGVRQQVLDMSWKYLHDNFHKFSQGNQIRIALALSTRNIPQVLEGEVKFVSMSVINIEKKPMGLDLGEIPESVVARLDKNKVMVTA